MSAVIHSFGFILLWNVFGIGFALDTVGTCGKPPINHMSGCSSSWLHSDGECKVMCLPGYEVADTNEISCNLNEHRWSQLTMCQLQIPTGCGGVLRESTGRVTSPSFPNDYTNNANCVWKIVANRYSVIRLTFDNFNLEYNSGCSYDALSVYHGASESETNTRIGKYCGQKSSFTLTSHGEVMTLQFKSDHSVGKSGFSAQYVIEHACGSTLSDASGTIQSPNYPEHYPNNVNCSWQINVYPWPALVIILHVGAIENETDCSYDRITVTSKQKTYTYCHSGDEMITINSSQVTLQFSSDHTVTAEGFHATYVPDCGPLSIENGFALSNETMESTVTEIVCDDGFQLQGPPNVTCSTELKRWTDIPTCAYVKCGRLDVRNGNVSTMETVYNTEVEVTCDEGYALQGATPVRCHSNGSWTDKPTCKPIVCSELSVVYGSVNTTSRGYGTVAHVYCDTGYTLTGDALVRCGHNTLWTDTPSCNIVDCGRLDVAHGTPDTNQTTYGAIVTISCDVGFTTSDLTVVFCQDTASWSGVPRCQPLDCGDLQVAHGSPNSTNTTFSAVVKINCDQGYKISEHNTTRCGENGLWSSQPVCQIVDCDPLHVSNGNLSTRETLYNTEVDVNCDEGFILQGETRVRCQSNRSWTDVPMCQPIECNELKVVHGNVNTTSRGYGTVAYLQCDTGYTVTGDAIVRCGNTATWTDIPACNIVDCGRLDVAHGAPDTNQTTYGAIVTISCDKGFTTSDLTVLFCQETSYWSGKPTCQPIDCGDLQVTNGSPNSTNTTYGAEIGISCDRGYRISEHITTRCSENGQWTNPPSCQMIDCGLLEVRNGNLSTMETVYNTEVEMICDEGYRLHGVSPVRCQDNGSWTDVPTCQPIVCSELSVVHGNVNTTSRGYGAMAHIECNKGYMLSRDKSVRCGHNATWTDVPSCDIVDCGVLEVQNGVSNLTEFTYNTVGFITCETGYQLTDHSPIVCGQDGQWSSRPYCLKIDCGEVNITHGITNTTETTFQTVVGLTCEAGYDVIGDSIVHCSENGTWSSLPYCLLVDCGDITILHGNISTAVTTYDTTVEATCHTGYKVNGTNIIRCQEDGLWSSVPACDVVDCGPLDVPNADVNTTVSIFSTNVALICHKGYYITGSPVIHCKDNGTWSSTPSCLIVDCGPIKFNKGKVNTTDTTLNTFVQITCERGYILNGNDIVRCQEDGAWSGSSICERVGLGDSKARGSSKVDSTTGNNITVIVIAASGAVLLTIIIVAVVIIRRRKRGKVEVSESSRIVDNKTSKEKADKELQDLSELEHLKRADVNHDDATYDGISDVTIPIADACDMSLDEKPTTIQD